MIGIRCCLLLGQRRVCSEDRIARHFLTEKIIVAERRPRLIEGVDHIVDETRRCRVDFSNAALGNFEHGQAMLNQTVRIQTEQTGCAPSRSTS